MLGIGATLGLVAALGMTALMLALRELFGLPTSPEMIGGRPTHLDVADGALRAVVVPPGGHTVDLRFESDALMVGTIISSAAVLLMALLGLLLHRSQGEQRRALGRGDTSQPGDVQALVPTVVAKRADHGATFRVV
jgi:hypothetical protein